MEIDLSDPYLSKTEKYEIKRLLQRKNKAITDDLMQMWYLIDLVWDDFGCDHRKMEWRKINAFYAHPVWLLNGLFIEQHELSRKHRHAISNWVIESGLNTILDYGGGFGTLACFIAEKNDDVNVNIFEPYHSDYGIKRIRDYHNVALIEKLNKRYDCLLCIDVMEHLPDPVMALATMICSVKSGGYLIIANAFYPLIKCHLPETFHLRYSFQMFARIMGLKLVGALTGSHATIYRKMYDTEISWKIIRRLERISDTAFPILDGVHTLLKSTRNALRI